MAIRTRVMNWAETMLYRSLLPSLLVGLTGILAKAQDCLGPNLLISGGVPGHIFKTMQKLDGVSHCIGLDSDHLFFMNDTLQAGQTHPLSGAIGLSLVPPLSVGGHGSAFVNGDGTIFSIGFSTSGTLTTWLRWSVFVRRSGCAFDTVLATPLVHRRDRASDAVRASYPTDLVYVGTAHVPIGAGCSQAAKENQVYGFQADNGVRQWSFDTHELDAVRGLALDPLADLLFVTSDATLTFSQRSLWALNIIGGVSITWSVSAGRIWAPPVLRDGRIYVAGTSGSELVALDSSTGAVIWSLPTGGFPIVSGLIAPLVPPYHDAIVAQDFLGSVYLARDLGSSGSWDWVTPISLSGLPAVPPIAVDPVAGAIYAGDDDGNLHQLNASTGAIENTTVLDVPGTVPHSLFLDWPLKDGERVELVATSSGGALGRFCIKDGGLLRNTLGTSERGSSPTGSLSFEDTDTGDVSVVVHRLKLNEPTTLTHFEAVAAGPGPCDLGRGPTPCLEQMEFYLMAWPLGVPIQGNPADPTAPGKLFHVDVTPFLTLVRRYGSSRFNGGDLVETSLLSFDLTGLDLQCPLKGCRVALMGRGSASQLGELAIPFVEHAPHTDTLRNHPQFPASTPIPATAVRIRGESRFPRAGVWR